MRLQATGALLLTAAFAIGAAAQTTGQKNPPLVIDSMTGKDLFDFYCASCHGRDGKGRGPVAAALKVPPADLTIIARRHEGTFPDVQIGSFVTNGATNPAHGTREMPVWGPIFRGLDPSDALVTIRIDNVVAYVRSLQVR